MRFLARTPRLLLALAAIVAVAAVWMALHVRAAEEKTRRLALARAYASRGDVRRATQAYASAERAGIATASFLTECGAFRLRHGDPAAAEALYRRALDRDPRHGPAHAHLAELYYRREQWPLAAREYEAAAVLMPGQAAELYVSAGMVYLGTRDSVRARRMLESALRVRPGFEPARTALDGLGSARR